MGAPYSRLICPICLQNYDTPKLLPCLHSVCQNCLEKCIENSTVSEEKGHLFQCPVCMKIITKPPADLPVEKWAGHFPVNAVLLSLLPKAKTKVDQLCDPCLYGGTSITATSYCATCEEVLCQMCDNVHRRSKATREHTFLDPAIAITLAVSTTCTYHWNKRVEFYCVSHNAMCCSDCVVDSHKACNDIVKLKQHVDKLFKDEEPLMITDRIKQLDNQLDTYTAENDKTLLELKTSTEDMTIEIDKLIATLNEAKSHILREREGLLAEESRKRLGENQQCQSLKAALKDSLHLIDAVVKYGDKHQRLVILHKIKEQLAYCEKTIHNKHSGVIQVKAKLPLNKHFISLRKLTDSQVAKIEVTENKLKLCLPVYQNCAASSDSIRTTPDEGLPSTATTSRDLDPDEDENEVEKSSDFGEQKIRTSDLSSTHFEINEECKDLEIEDLNQMGNKRETVVTFENTAVVQSVLEKQKRESFYLQNMKPTDEKYVPPPPDPLRLFLKNLSPRVTQDCLSRYLEPRCKAIPVEILFRRLPGTAFVTFSKPPDVKLLLKRVKKKRLEGRYIKVIRVPITRSVHLTGLPLSSTRDTVVLYFENAKCSGGGPVADVKFGREKKSCLVTFENVEGDLSYPSTWRKMAPNENMICVTLNPSDKEYNDVSQKFLATAGSAGQQRSVSAYDMNFGSPQLIVIKIERVQNKSLYQQYEAKKRHMEQQNSGKANEKELWYTTAGTKIANINNNGFNRSHGGSGSHGAGTYFAVNASYSIGRYCNPDASGHRHIYLANVLTGDSVVAGSATRVLPPKDPRYPHITYDSTTDSTVNPQMFVIFHNAQAYPSYLITFC